MRSAVCGLHALCRNAVPPLSADEREDDRVDVECLGLQASGLALPAEEALLDELLHETRGDLTQRELCKLHGDTSS